MSIEFILARDMLTQTIINTKEMIKYVVIRDSCDHKDVYQIMFGKNIFDTTNKISFRCKGCDNAVIYCVY